MSKGYEMRYFARKWNLTTAQAVAMIREHGEDRTKLNRAAVEFHRKQTHSPQR